MENVNILIAQNRLDEAIDILLQTNPSQKMDLLAIKSRLSSLASAKRIGTISFADETTEKNKITAALLSISDGTAETPNNTPTPTPTPVMTNTNPLKQFNNLYRDSIHADLNSLDFVESNVRTYVTQLGNIFSNPALFNSFLQPLNDAAYNDVNTSMADKRLILKGILENLVAKENGLRTRLEGQIEKMNAEVDFVERLNQFFTNPTPIGWKNVYQTVGLRFSDRSLFGENVSSAWDAWDAKLSQLDVFDIAFDLAQGEQMRKDLGAFLAANLAIKNFNYQ